MQATVVLHYTDSQNYLACVVSGTSMTLYHVTAGLYHAMAFPNAYAALTPGAFYWLQVTQFPTPPASATGLSDPPAAQVILANDTAGAIGATIQTAGPAPTADSVTALVGKPALWSTGANLAVGGALASVQQVSLFGPGGWLCTPSAGAATGVSSGAWEGDQARGAGGTLANTYPNGPVTSYGAARVDLAPAGTVDALWRLYAGGAPAATSAIAVQTPGNVVYARVAVKSSGLGNGCTVALKYSEYDASGALLRSGTLQTLTIAGGVQLAWPAAGAWNLAGNWGTGANCAYVDLQVEVADTVAGNRANGTLWLDNAQAWDATRLGVTTMAYHELRFPQSPAQLVLTGLLGDLPAPALLQLGSYVSAWARGGHLSYGLGRLGAYRPAAILSAASHGYYGAGLAPQATPVLDAAGYGGYYVKAQVDNGGWQPRAFSPKVADALGVYHLLARYRTFDAAPGSVLLRVQADETLHPWYADAGTLSSVATYYGPYATPLAAANQWTAVDAGQLALPPFPSGALSDPSQLYVVGRGQWVGSGAAAEGDASWMAWLPVDGSLLLGTLNFPSNSGVASMTSAVWVYADGLLVNQGSAASGPATSYSLETAAIPNPAHAAGGVGTLTTAAVNVNSGADPYLTLDPTLGQWNGAGVNQAVGVVYDEQATVLPLAVELLYSPLYLEPR